MPVTQAASFNPEAAQRDARLNSYLARHNQLAGTASKGFVSFVPIISSQVAPADTESTEEPVEENTAENEQELR